MGADTIFALSSGAPPAAIAVVRISGPAAFAAGRALAGTLPAPRTAVLRHLRDAAGDAIDRALVMAFPGPHSATGEDLLELHLHGGRAIVRAVLAALAIRPGLRPAVPGEFTRRALANGVIDLAQAEGLGDLLSAETEAARRHALAAADGAVSRAVAAWNERLVALAARAEALIDYADEDDVAADPAAEAALRADVERAAAALRDLADQPPVERLRDGIAVVIAGPPNSGKSSLLNALAAREVAIASPVAGTTRDVLEAAVMRDGIAWRLIDVAGLRPTTDDPVEAIGIARARNAIAGADIVLWLGDDPPPDPAMIALHARADLADRPAVPGRLALSAQDGRGLADLWRLLAVRARDLMPVDRALAFNARQLRCLAAAADRLAMPSSDPLLLAEALREARMALSELSGAVATVALLDALFRRFCIGK